MGIMMKNKSLLLVNAFLMALLLAACGADTPSSTPPMGEENLEVNELSVSEDTVAEPIFINNCGNPANAEQVSEHSQTVMVEVGAGLEVGSGVVKGSVEGKYSSTKSVKKSQKVVAAPYTNMKFILLWTERVSEGTVTASGRSGQAKYRVAVPIAVEQTSAENLGCPTSIPISFTVTPTTTSTPTRILEIATSTMTLVPTPAYACVTVNEQPRENTELKRGQRFKVGFTLVNNGSNVWPEGLVLVITSNPYNTVDPAPSPIKVPRVQPGGSINVGLYDAKAPNALGHYVVEFQLGDGICSPYVAFDVIK
jgi:hypothetical protein